MTKVPDAFVSAVHKTENGDMFLAASAILAMFIGALPEGKSHVQDTYLWAGAPSPEVNSLERRSGQIFWGFLIELRQFCSILLLMVESHQRLCFHLGKVSVPTLLIAHVK